MTCLVIVGDILQQGTAGTIRRMGVPVLLVDRWGVGFDVLVGVPYVLAIQ